MNEVYHAGEIAVQTKAGTRLMAERIGRSVHNSIPAVGQDFIEAQPFIIASSVDERGNVWTSLLTGSAGFVQVTGETSLRLTPDNFEQDPLAHNLQVNNKIGLLAIEPATRRRMRINGLAGLAPSGVINVETEQVYSNCPKYIQAREITAQASPAANQTEIWRGSQLTSAQASWLEQADTFFIGTYHTEGGADTSHRGGSPGFVKVVDSGRLLFPDYSGNKMFQTLGNLAANPQSGLLFLDYERGTVLQLSGQARIIWEPSRLNEFAGAERLIEFDITHVLERTNVLPYRWNFLDYSKFNPA